MTSEMLEITFNRELKSSALRKLIHKELNFLQDGEMIKIKEITKVEDGVKLTVEITANHISDIDVILNDLVLGEDLLITQNLRANG